MKNKIKSSNKTSKKVNLKSKVDRDKNKKSEHITIKQNSINVLNNELIQVLKQEGKLVPVERNAGTSNTKIICKYDNSKSK